MIATEIDRRHIAFAFDEEDAELLCEMLETIILDEHRAEYLSHFIKSEE